VRNLFACHPFRANHPFMQTGIAEPAAADAIAILGGRQQEFGPKDVSVKIFIKRLVHLAGVSGSGDTTLSRRFPPA
jgi:excinuclease UvrABC ATPase subunit